MFDIYKNIIFSISKGRVNLISNDSISADKLIGIPKLKVKIKKPVDVGKAREKVKEVLSAFFAPKQINQIILCVSEATTNIIKHADNGVLEVREIENDIRIIVSDNGKGIPLDILPKVLFQDGFSTKNSFGFGYKIINKFTNSIKISSSKQGTILIMDFKR